MKTKKILLGVAIVVGVGLIALVVVTTLFLDSIIKKGVETVGPHITQTDMRLAGVSLSVFSGEGKLKGFFLGNPEGFKAESAVQVERISVGVRPASVLSDKIHVTHVHVIDPHITFEAPGLNLKANNLSKILENVQSATGGADTNQAAADTGAGKKIQIDDFLLSGAKVRVKTGLSAGQTISVTVPDIHLTDLGKESDGVTPAEVTSRVMKELVNSILPAAQKAVTDVGKGATDAAEKAAKGTVDQATKGIKGLLGK